MKPEQMIDLGTVPTVALLELRTEFDGGVLFVVHGVVPAAADGRDVHFPAMDHEVTITHLAHVAPIDFGSRRVATGVLTTTPGGRALSVSILPETARRARLRERSQPYGPCRVCGCTSEDCRTCIEKTGAPCWWVEADLCSACSARCRS